MINVKMQPNEVQNLSPKIAVIGVGGAGGNAVNNMISSNLEGCEFIVCNTDSQALGNSLCEDKIQLGANITGGLGAGSKPEVGQAAAEEALEDVLRYVDGANMAFITAGMGGGTGTGAAPVIAKACRQQGILTVGVVTKPFHFEGAHRMQQAEKGIEEMQQYVDTLIVIPNQNLFRIADEKTTFAEGFKLADTVLQSGVRGVTDLMVRPGLVNLDFADIRTAMLQMGKAMMGTGEATGDKRAVEAAEAAINNPLLDDVSMKGAKGVIINVTGGFDMTLFEADEACNRIRDEVDPDANIIFGATFDENMDGYMRVSIVATGIEREMQEKRGGRNDGVGGPPSKFKRPDLSSSANEDVGPVLSSLPTEKPSEPAPLKETASEKVPPLFLSGRDVIRGITAPSPVRQVSDSDEGASASVLSAGKTFVPSGQSFGSEGGSRASSESSERGVRPLRGTTYKDSFIPPRPMETDVKIPETGVGTHISNFYGAHVQSSESESRGRGVPEKTESSPDSKTHTPSLFERITGSVQQHIENLRDDSDLIRSPSPSAESERKPLTGAPSQGALNISSPSAKPGVKIDDELDIPAFLRRQAN